jgi:hypothetical protein
MIVNWENKFCVFRSHLKLFHKQYHPVCVCVWGEWGKGTGTRKLCKPNARPGLIKQQAFLSTDMKIVKLLHMDISSLVQLSYWRQNGCDYKSGSVLIGRQHQRQTYR